MPGDRCSDRTGSLPDTRNLGTELIFTSALFNRHRRCAFSWIRFPLSRALSGRGCRRLRWCTRISGRACGDGRRIDRAAPRGSPQAVLGYRAVHAARPARGFAGHRTLCRRARALAGEPVAAWPGMRCRASGSRPCQHARDQPPFCRRGLGQPGPGGMPPRCSPASSASAAAWRPRARHTLRRVCRSASRRGAVGGPPGRRDSARPRWPGSAAAPRPRRGSPVLPAGGSARPGRAGLGQAAGGAQQAPAPASGLMA